MNIRRQSPFIGPVPDETPPFAHLPEFDIESHWQPRSLWSDGQRLYVPGLDTKTEFVRSYKLKPGTSPELSSFETAVVPNFWSPRAIWSDGTTMWVHGTTKRIPDYKVGVVAHDLATGQRQRDKEIDLTPYLNGPPT